MYYPNRQGIEDRVFRIKTDRSSATSLPEPRTNHNLSNIEVLSRDGGEIKLRFNWLTLSYRYARDRPALGHVVLHDRHAAARGR